MYTSNMLSLFSRSEDFSALLIVMLKMSLKYCKANWYMGSISQSEATTKNNTDPLVATGRYLEIKEIIVNKKMSNSRGWTMVAILSWQEKKQIFYKKKIMLALNFEINHRVHINPFIMQ